MPDHPLGPICALWRDKIAKAREYRRKVFDETANECMKFFDGPHDWMYSTSSKTGTGMVVDREIPTTFRMTVNKVAELVQLFIPAMYHRNPFRQVNVRKPEIPAVVMNMLMGNQMGAQQMMQQDQMTLDIDTARAELLQWFLNYLPNELGYVGQSRLAVTEALIKGRGVQWTELYQPKGSTLLLPRTSYDTVDNLLIDPDAETVEDAEWIARRCRHPTWRVEQEYPRPGQQRGWLKGSLESIAQQSQVDTSDMGKEDRRAGATYDTIEYWKVWSKMGLGQYLSGSKETDAVRDHLDQFGENVYLVITPSVPFPLNLPPEMMELPIDDFDPETGMENPEGVANKEAIYAALRWPIPFWADRSWPMTHLDFHEVPRRSWPQAHMKSGLGELKFINWAMSFLAGKVRLSSRDFIAIAEHLADDVVKQIEEGDDMTIIRFKQSMNKQIGELIQFLQHPEMNGDLWKVIAAVMEMFEKRVGLTELVYGMSSRQMRSAEEASLKGDQLNIRPDDMAERVESWATAIARKEAFVSRWFCGPEHVSQVFGEPFDPQPMIAQIDPMTGQEVMVPGVPNVGTFTSLWAQFVYIPLNYQDPESISRVVREFDYRIEAGSIRKPNRDRDMANMDLAMQTLFPSLMQFYQMTGMPNQVNALITDWAKAHDLDPRPYLLPPFTPAPPPDEGGKDGGGSGGGKSSTIPMAGAA